MGYAEAAITAFEHVTNLRATLHDIGHVFWNELPEDRFRHSHPVCTAVKNGPTGAACRTFEIDDLRAVAERYPHGRVHRCHAGVIEAVAPVFSRGVLRFVLFAGPMDAGQRVPLDDDRWSPGAAIRLPDAALAPSASGPRRVAPAELAMVRELLVQLGARLQSIADSTHHVSNAPASREVSIRHILGARYHEAFALADLAAYLHLSPDRTRHVVSDLFGQSFRQLLRGYRLTAARALLLSSSLSIGEIAARCGFDDASSFARAFRLAHGASPRSWRRRLQG